MSDRLRLTAKINEIYTGNGIDVIVFEAARNCAPKSIRLFASKGFSMSEKNFLYLIALGIGCLTFGLALDSVLTYYGNKTAMENGYEQVLEGFPPRAIWKKTVE